MLRHLRLSRSRLWQTADSGLAELGERYHAHRKALMQSLWLGLTKIYNLFHVRDLSPETVTQVSKKDADTAAAGVEALLELRRLHVELDFAVRDAYDWQDLDLEHGFHEVETLPENDRVRYTISPTARREVLNRLLAENHARADYRVQGGELKGSNLIRFSKGRRAIEDLISVAGQSANLSSIIRSTASRQSSSSTPLNHSSQKSTASSIESIFISSSETPVLQRALAPRTSTGAVQTLREGSSHR